VVSLRKKKDEEGRMSVLDHLRELRRRLIVVMIIVALGAVVGWVLYDHILSILKDPYCNVPYRYRQAALNQSRNQCNLVFRGPLDGFTIRLKVSVVAGAIITAPLWLFQLWAFVTPGLRKNERRWTVGFVLVSSLLFALGMTLAYVTLSKGLEVLITSAGQNVQASLDVTSYITFVILMLVIFGASFELPLLIVMLNLVRILPYSVLKRGQRIGMFLIFVFAAVATPSTDPFTMTAMAVPMCVLFEAAVLFAFFNDRRRARRAVAAEAAELPDDVLSHIEPVSDPLPVRTSSSNDAFTQDLP
jgi:sec-independent protein translocase protein TatC